MRQTSPHLSHRLLTPAEERALGQTIQAGITWPERVVGKAYPDPILTPEALRARNKLVLHNLRLARSGSLVNGFARMPLEDRDTLAVMGLITAANKFDPEKYTRFSTFAKWWIRHSLVRGLQNESTVVRFPCHIWENASKGKKALEAGRAASTKEQQCMAQAARALGIASIDKPITEGGFTLADKLQAPDPGHSARFIHDGIEEGLSALKPRERNALRLLFLEDKPVGEAARVLGLSPDSLNRSKRKALKLLRQNSAIQGAWGELVG